MITEIVYQIKLKNIKEYVEMDVRKDVRIFIESGMDYQQEDHLEIQLVSMKGHQELDPLPE